MTLWLASAFVAVFLFAGLVAVTFLPWLAAQYRRYGRLRGWPAAVSTAVGLYACGLVAFTLFPLPDEPPGACSRSATWQLVPLGSVQDALARASGSDPLGFLTHPAVLQVLLNVVLFVPLGVLARWRFGVGLLPAVLLGAAVSLGIETTQGTAVLGAYPCPYRVADVDDLLTNTLGALVGGLLAAPARRLLPDPVPAPAADLEPPTLPRRGLAVVVDLLALVAAAGLATVTLTLGVAAVAGTAALDTTTFDTLRAGAGYAVPVLLVGLLPLLGRHRSTPGQAAVGLTVADRTGTTAAPRVRVLLRSVLHWAPLAVLVDLADTPRQTGLAIAAWLAVLLLAVLVLPGRRSPGGVLSGTTVATRARVDAAETLVGDTAHV